MVRAGAAILATLMCSASMAREPGCVERVIVDGTVRFDRAAGVRLLGHAERLDARTAFRLASVSKQFTAAAILTLVEEGQLSLDTTLGDLLPQMPSYAHAITVRQLLTHLSGLPDYETLMDQAAAASGPAYTPAHQIDDAAVLRLLAESTAPLAPAGTRWAYSNSGYVVLGQIVAAVSGMSFAAYLEQKVFAPHHLSSTHLRVPDVTSIPRRAYGHARQAGSGEWRVSDQSSTSATGGDGGIYSTIEDLQRWLQAIETGDSVLSRHADQVFSVAVLQSGAATFWPIEPDEDNLDPGGPVAYGFGWFLDPAFGQTRRWHFGTTEGFRTAIDWFPDRKVSSIVLCNRMDIDARALALENARPFLTP